MAKHPLENWDGTIRAATSDDVMDAMLAVSRAESEWESVKPSLEHYAGHHGYESLAQSRQDFGVVLDAYIDQRITRTQPP